MTHQLPGCMSNDTSRLPYHTLPAANLHAHLSRLSVLTSTCTACKAIFYENNTCIVRTTVLAVCQNLHDRLLRYVLSTSAVEKHLHYMHNCLCCLLCDKIYAACTAFCAVSCCTTLHCIQSFLCFLSYNNICVADTTACLVCCWTAPAMRAQLFVLSDVGEHVHCMHTFARLSAV